MKQESNKEASPAQLAAWRALWERLLARKQSDGDHPSLPSQCVHTEKRKAGGQKNNPTTCSR